MMDIKAAENSGENTMIAEGYAVIYDSPAVFRFGDAEYREVIARGALDNTDIKDVAFKYNHSDHFMIMARTRSKTLQLIKDERGLKVIAELANTTAGKDLYELIKRGDIDKMSFAFTVKEDKYDKETRTRTILSIDKLFDVSAVDLPAYEATNITARAFQELESTWRALESEEKRKKLLLYTYTF
jgi:HK97 family phage prohead protease